MTKVLVLYYSTYGHVFRLTAPATKRLVVR